MAEHPRQQTPGGLIRTAREAKGISMAAMSERTKIPPPVLDAIESDEYHKVSGALYIKSFLRTCAVEVGLDSDEVLDLYGKFSGEIKRPAGGPEGTWEEETVEISHLGLPWRNIALVGVALIVVGLLSLVFLRGSGPEDEDLAAVADSSQDVSPNPVATTVDPAAEAAQVVVRDMEQTPPPETSPPIDTGQYADLPLAEIVRDDERPSEQLATEPDQAAPEFTAPTVVAAQEGQLPLPLVGGPRLSFAGGDRKPVVLRIICDRPLGIQVKQDAEQDFESAVWPAAGSAAPPLPATGIVPGRVYTVSRGLVVYWGAEDHVSLRLDRTDGVEVALNGRVRNVRNLRPGGELLLDDHGN